MHIGICDDEQSIRLYLKTLIETYMDSKEYQITEFSTGRDLLDYFTNKEPHGLDLLFLDVALSDMDGISVAKAIREQMAHQQKAIWGSLPLLIFVTGSQEHMHSAFSVNAFQYIVKPIQEQEFQQVLAQAVREYGCLIQKKRTEPKELLVKSNSQMRKISAEDVYYIESSNRKVILNLQNEKIEFYDKISDLEENLKPDFFRIHKGYLVNMKYVERYDRTELCMKNGDKLLISKYKYHDFVNAYIQYIAREK